MLVLGDDGFFHDPILKFPPRQQLAAECDISAKEFALTRGDEVMKFTIDEVPTVISLLAEALKQWGERR